MPLRLSRDDGVARLALDRPPVNVLDTALLEELATTVGVLQEDAALRLIVLAANGRNFSAGVDVGEHLGETLGPLLEAFLRATRALLASEIPTLAVVQGAALGGACELAACCDLVLAADDAKLGVPEIALGVVPPVAAALFPRWIGRQRAAGLVLTGASIDGTLAAGWGLVWRSVPPDRLHAEAEDVIASFRAKSAWALRLAKRTLREAARYPDLDHAATAAAEVSRLGVPQSADAQEGLRAFLEKRAPVWTHR